MAITLSSVPISSVNGPPLQQISTDTRPRRPSATNPMENNSCTTELIDGNGMFNVNGIDQFSKEVKFAECGISYAVVSIFGPQSSGKSTLLNCAFGTNFREMNASNGRSQTTKGIWIAKGDVIDPCTIVMDLEGTDGSERQDDTAFEKQSALFALAVSDIVLINMWCHDIGREHAANKPLLRIVFQAMMRLFTPRKTTLMFIIRDKTSTPLEILRRQLLEDTQKIWDSVPKPHIHKDTLLNDFFNVDVVSFPNYETQNTEFKQQVNDLRQRLFHSIAPGGLAKDRTGVVPASAFSLSAQEIWKLIKENKDLDLPSHKVMVATVRCEEIAAQKYTDFTQNNDWLRLEEASHHPHIQGFGRKLNLILTSCFSEYDEEVLYFDDEVRTQKKKHLKDELLRLVQPAFESVFRNLRSGALEQFKETFSKALNAGEGFANASRRCKQIVLEVFDKGCADSVCEQANWDASKVRKKLVHDIAEHITTIRSLKLSELKSHYEVQLNKALSGPVGVILQDANDDTWRTIASFLRHEAQSTVSKLDDHLSAFDLDEEARDSMLANLEGYAIGVVEATAIEEAEKALTHMKHRFMTVFKSAKADKMSDIEQNARSAKAECLKLLSVLSVIRLEDESDDIYEALTNAFEQDSLDGRMRLMAADTWKNVPSSRILITPVQCISLLQKFKEEIEDTVNQARDAMERESKRRIDIGITAGVEALKFVHSGVAVGAIIARFIS